MAKKKTNGDVKTTDYRHIGEKRTNIPPAKIAAEGRVPRVPRVRYHYSPHLPPTLQSDPSGNADALPELVAEAGRRPLTAAEQKLLAEALRNHQPWLEWAGKREQCERSFFEVEPVALHIHERVSTQAILRVLAREDAQRGLFADPEQPYGQAVQFYRHSVDWANRVILGDSLQVMASLARRENMAGKVQMIYLDPPYGINYSSNFQPEIGRVKVKEADSDLIREPEAVKAFRDTWLLGSHSYMKYLDDRLRAARELLAPSGSIFVQIGDAQSHRVRQLMDETFGPQNFVAQINFRSMMPLASGDIESVYDYLLWYASDRPQMRYRNLFVPKSTGDESEFSFRQCDDGRHELRSQNSDWDPTAPGIFKRSNLSSSGYTESCTFDIEFEGELYHPVQGKSWRTTPAGVARLMAANRIFRLGKKLYFKLYFKDFTHGPLVNSWHDTIPFDRKLYVVRTTTTVIERCMLMTTDPGDLVLDPTCGSGTTAHVAEQWGRRWITVDTSRVAVSIARQRLLTAEFDFYRTRGASGTDQDPAVGLVYKKVPHLTLKSVAQNVALDPIFDRHRSLLTDRLKDLNSAIRLVTPALREKLVSRLRDKEKRVGKKSLTEADRRRWMLPEKEWKEWQIPFDCDRDWPGPLREALTAYRAAWAARMAEINACIAANGDTEELVDKPEIVSGVLRVSGPFTVEGVRPEELSNANDQPELTPTSFKDNPALTDDDQNVAAYLSQMVNYLLADGLTFLGNNHRSFGRLDPLFEDASASLIHAEGRWNDSDHEGHNNVAVSFGPQHGPVTALQVEDAIRAAGHYDELVLAGFSFDAEAFAIVEEQNHPKLRIHLAQIRPDLNEAMHGLLKSTPKSELFSVFGQPELELEKSGDEWRCILRGVDIYNPVDNTVRSSGADKVAAWFLDSDFDGRCFCITQAFFPDQDAWEKIAKALGSSADPEAFEKLKGTKSLPFSKGKYGRIAVKVIDPRGNEVMAVRKLS